MNAKKKHILSTTVQMTEMTGKIYMKCLYSTVFVSAHKFA